MGVRPMQVAAYVRRSTNELLQADSLIAQEEVLRRYAAEHGHKIVAVYADSASGRSDDRPEFQRLMRDVERGATFEGILCTTISRWGRWDNPDAAAFYEYLCAVRGGVQVIYVLEDLGPEESPITPLQKTMKRWLAAEFSRDRSRMVRRSQARVVGLGFMHGGPAPFGLKRILVNRDGEYVSDLVAGDRKALSNQRVKLAPGASDQVMAVQEIYRAYVEDRQSLKAIADQLNRRGIRGRDGGRWQPSSVGYVLRNPAYAGFSRYTVRSKRQRSQVENASSAPAIITAGAYEPIVELEIWQKAQMLLGDRTWRKTDRDLANELRTAYEKWGHVEAAMMNCLDDHACFETYANRFRNGYPEALEIAYGDQYQQAKGSLLELIKAHFDVRDFEGGWLLDTLLHVGFKAAWPRARWGSLFWEWEYRGDEVEDITVGFAFTPPPEVRVVDVFLFQTGKFSVRKQWVRRKLTATKPPNRFVLSDSPDRIVRYFQHAIYFRNVRAEQVLIAAASQTPLVNVAELARRLGWNENATRVIYEKVLARGVVPPMRQRHGRRVEIVCPRCSVTRRLPVSEALALKSDICFECHRAMPTTKKIVKCPTCGRERVRMPSEIAAMKEGENSLCHDCALVKGRSIRAARAADRRPLEAARSAALRELALLVVAAMKLQPEEFSAPVVWSTARRRTPTLRWREPSTGSRLRLTLGSSDDLIPKLLEMPSQFVAACLDRANWCRLARCDGRNDEAWTVEVVGDIG